MTRFVLTLIAAIFLTVFTIQNIDQVDMQLPFVQNPFRIRLIYLLLTTYVLGVVSAYLWMTGRQWQHAKRKKVSSQEDKELDDYL